jgi:hypothetical protein
VTDRPMRLEQAARRRLETNASCSELDAARMVRWVENAGGRIASLKMDGREIDLSRLPRSYVYVVGFDNYVKIGRSTEVDKRIQALQTSVPKVLNVYAIFPNRDADEERKLHHRFRADRLYGEWFLLSSSLRAFIEQNGRAGLTGAPEPKDPVASP